MSVEAAGPGALLFRRGLAAYADRRFFEAHEEWEQLWAGAIGADRRFLHALIQLAAASLHLEAGRRRPAGRLLRAAREKLQAVPELHWGLDLAPLRAGVAEAERLLLEDAPVLAFRAVLSLDGLESELGAQLAPVPDSSPSR